jgi:hypothetical protein
MDAAILKRLEKKVDAISEFLEDIYLTKEEEELLEKADKIVKEGRLDELSKVV